MKIKIDCSRWAGRSGRFNTVDHAAYTGNYFRDFSGGDINLQRRNDPCDMCNAVQHTHAQISRGCSIIPCKAG